MGKTIRFEENPRRSNLRNVLALMKPVYKAGAIFGVTVLGWTMPPDRFTQAVLDFGRTIKCSLDPNIVASALVGFAGTVFVLSVIAGCARLVEYSRVLKYIRTNGIQSYQNLLCDYLYKPLYGTKWRRRVMALALTTLERRAVMPAMVMRGFISKGKVSYTKLSWRWLIATLSPANIRH